LPCISFLTHQIHKLQISIKCKLYINILLWQKGKSENSTTETKTVTINMVKSRIMELKIGILLHIYAQNACFLLHFQLLQILNCMLEIGPLSLFQFMFLLTEQNITFSITGFLGLFHSTIPKRTYYKKMDPFPTSGER
jgi:hypothetical protein